VSYFLLRRVLEAGARPSAVILDVKPSILLGSPDYNIRYWQEVLTLRESLDLASADRHFTLFVKVLVGRVLPSFRSRHEIRGALVAALRGEASPLRSINQVCQRNWRANSGANVAAKNPGFTGVVDPEQRRNLHTNIWHTHRANTTYLTRILELTRERGIPVYWLLPPLAPALQAQREESGAEKGYEKFIGSMQARFSHLTVVDGRHSGYEPRLFVDATHLDGQGANTLSGDLARLLKRELSASSHANRWLPLPAYRDMPALAAWEDIDQSKKIASAIRLD
jgi:hypothetical protein